MYNKDATCPPPDVIIQKRNENKKQDDCVYLFKTATYMVIPGYIPEFLPCQEEERRENMLGGSQVCFLIFLLKKTSKGLI